MDAAVVAIASAALTYIVSYGRYRKLLTESPVRLTTAVVWRWSLLRLIAPTPRREAVMDFMAKTLARRDHYQFGSPRPSASGPTRHRAY